MYVSHIHLQPFFCFLLYTPCCGARSDRRRGYRGGGVFLPRKPFNRPLLCDFFFFGRWQHFSRFASSTMPKILVICKISEFFGCVFFFCGFVTAILKGHRKLQQQQHIQYLRLRFVLVRCVHERHMHLTFFSFFTIVLIINSQKGA